MAFERLPGITNQDDVAPLPPCTWPASLAGAEKAEAENEPDDARGQVA